MIKLQLTPEDVEEGKKLSSSDCAIARRIKIQLPYAAYVKVSDFFISIDNKRWQLPNSIASWISTFDCGWKPEPISIILPEYEDENVNSVKSHSELENIGTYVAALI